MERVYNGLPAAASVEEAIVLAQRLIQRDLEQRAALIPNPPDPVDREVRPAA